MDRVRALSIAFRTLHLVGFALVLGGVVFGVEAERVVAPLLLAVASGVALIGTEVWVLGPEWFLMGKGLAVAAKLTMLLAYPLLPGRQGALLLAVVVVSSVGAHMPARFRHASLLGRRRGREGPAALRPASPPG